MLRPILAASRGVVAPRTCSLHRCSCLEMATTPNCLRRQLPSHMPAQLPANPWRCRLQTLSTWHQGTTHPGRRGQPDRRLRMDAVHGAAPRPAADAFSIELAVRDYELDQFGVVNNAVYANYAEHARHEFLAHIGIDAHVIARDGDALALAEQTIRFLAPLRSRDRVRVTVHTAKCTGARIIMEQQIVKLPCAGDAEQQVVATVTAMVVSLDQQYRPRRIGTELQRRLLRGEAHTKAGVAVNILD